MKSIKNKNIIPNIIAVLLGISVVALLIANKFIENKDLLNNKYISEKHSLQISTSSLIPNTDSYPEGFICIGNELTYGNKENEFSYPETLSQILTDKRLNSEVVNLGFENEDTKMIMARTGAFKMILEPVKIPSESQKCYVRFMGEDNSWIIPLANSDQEYMEVSIDGVDGKLYIEERGSKNNTFFLFYFIRNEDGEAINVKAGTPIIPVESQKYKGYFPIVWLTDGYTTKNIDNFINNVQKIVNIYNPNEFLVLSPLDSQSNNMEELEQSLENMFDDKFLNIRAQMLEPDYYIEYELELSIDDIDAIQKNTLPPSYYNYTNGSLTEKGCEFVAKAVLETFSN